MKLAISLFVLIAIAGTSAKQQTTPLKNTQPPIVENKQEKLITKDKELLKPSEDLLKSLKELENKSITCNKAINKILKSQKDSLSLVANKN
jgi:hypothetical protein